MANRMNQYSNPNTGAQTPPADAPKGEERIRVNGYGQVLEMLKIADPDFRDSLLRRLAAKDRELARQLAQELRNLGLL